MATGPGVQVQGNGQATVAVFPANYFDDPNLRLAFDGPKNFSIDEAGAKKLISKANVPLAYVQSLQTDLITLKYLPAKAADGVYTAATKRAVLIFQRHAARVYRMPGPSDVQPGQTFKGAVDGICNQATAKEIQVWITSQFVRPLGRFKTRSLNVAGATPDKQLREDAADEWEAIVAQVAAAGGILTGEGQGYGDTLRTLSKQVAAKKAGASSFSFHFAGRAVDIDQAFAGGGKAQRYFIVKEVVGADTFWRLFCKTDLQDGTQGTKMAKGAVQRMTDMVNQTTADIPAGSYIDMTAMIEASGKFSRIHAQSDFGNTALPNGSRYNKTEWWHFQYMIDVQKTFQDEMELIGISEKQLFAAGWTTEAELDHPPG
jgi:hypothetical protein